MSANERCAHGNSLDTCPWKHPPEILRPIADGMREPDFSHVWGIADPEVRRRLAPSYIGRQCQDLFFNSVYICSLECAEVYMSTADEPIADSCCSVCRKPEGR